MKNEILLSLILLSVTSSYSHSALSESLNPIFGSNSKQISTNVGQSFRKKLDREDLYFRSVSFSQPMMLFNLPARRNLEIGGFSGRDRGQKFIQDHEGSSSRMDYSKFDLELIGLSGDIALYHTNRAYLIVNLGIYYKNRTTRRIGSGYTFGEKLGIGYRLDMFNVEFNVMHFSNGSTTAENGGQNFMSMSVAVGF